MADRFVTVARADEIAPGSFRKVTLDGRDFIIANAEGTFYAVADLCSHEDYPLSYGCLDGNRIKCSLHGSRFSLETGEPMEEPADEPIETFSVEVVDGEVRMDPTPRRR